MKNKINNFLENGSLITIGLISYILIGLFGSLSLYGLSYIDGTTKDFFINDYYAFKLGFSIGMVVNFMFVLMIYSNRKNQKFWKYSEQVQNLIDNAKTKEDFDNIYTNNYPELINLAVGGQHITEIKRIKAVLETTLKYIK